MALPSSSTSVAETMARLSSKSGVTATIAIERNTSTVLQSTGTLGTMFASSVAASLVQPVSTSQTTTTSSGTGPSTIASPIERDGSATGIADPAEEHAFRDFAKRIWNYVNATAGLVDEMDSEDELKLLRLRTRKHELVIVPDAKFIFVVVHDVPSS